MTTETVEIIKRNIGDNVSITKGRDYAVPTIRVVPCTHDDAGDDEKALYITQGKDRGGVSLTIETLETIVRWAKGE